MMGVATSLWLMGLWSTQAKVDGIVLTTAWHWSRGSSFVNYPCGEPGHTPLYVGLRLHGALWTVTLYFSAYAGGFLFGDPGTYT